MKIRTSIAAACAAALIGGTGALLLPAAASAHSVTHTLKFTAIQQKSINFSKTTGASADQDVNSAGKIIGFDEIYFAFNPKTNTATGGVTLDINGGFLYGTLNLNTQGPVMHGKVTGGTGTFKGATGTITAKNLNKNGTRTAVTIVYTS
jgi:hypothetical protein